MASKDTSVIENEMVAERAQVENVLRIVRESVNKLKISLILPRCLENFVTVKEILANTEYEKCVHAAEEYLREYKNQDGSPQINFHLVNFIDMFHENSKVIELLPNWLDDISQEDKTLLDAFDMLLKITEERFRNSAISELHKEKKIHEVYHENESLKKSIIEFEKKIRAQKINLKWKLAAKDGILHKYEEELAFKKWDNNVRIQEEIVKSNRKIRNIVASSTIKQRELEEELQKAKENYDKLLRTNLIQEKETRDEKNKLLIQLQLLIRKYDQNIGDKIKESMQLEEEFGEQKKGFEIFLREYQKEEEKYESIVRAKEKKERKEHEEKLMLFMMNRAARVIQRYYRQWRREQKKKAKKNKGKGKKK